jgi:SAM-dependent methyltransferase
MWCPFVSSRFGRALPVDDERSESVLGRAARTGTTLDAMSEGVSTGNRWIARIEDDPDHSERYVERFRTMAADGVDLHGEARFVDAMVQRGARILDAGCGPGRVGGRLSELGHHVVGVDLDPVLIAAAEHDHPGPTWLVGDLAELGDLVELQDLGVGASDVEAGFDAVVCAGNVMGFLDPTTRKAVLDNLRTVLADGGRIVTGFGSGGHYPFDDFFDDVERVGLAVELRLSTWDLRPFSADSEFLVAVLARRGS